MPQELTIGKVAKAASVNLQTVRFYERQGLLAPATRTSSGYRLFSPEAAERIRFIKNAQNLGFTLREIGGLLRLSVRKRSSCNTVKKKAQKKLAAVEAKIAGLKGLEKTLKKLIRSCHRGASTRECPILESLEESYEG